MEQDFERRVQVLGITRSAYAVLSAIYHDNKTTPAELAAFVGIDGAAITRHLDRVEKQGLIQRKPSTRDRRSIDISLTVEGVTTVRKGRADSEATNRKFTECLTQVQVDQFRSAVQLMMASTDQALEEM